MGSVNNIFPINTIKTISVNTDSSNAVYGLFAGNTWTYQSNYNNVFNFTFNQQTTASLKGATTFTSINSINNSIFDKNTSRTYICGDFTLTNTASNIAYLQNTNWFPLGLTFAANSVVNCMVFSADKKTLYIGGKFASVTNGNTSAANFAIINVVNNYTVTAAASAPAPPNCTDINSLIFVGSTLYAGGENGSNIFFSSYNPSSPGWTPLLTPQTAGSINILYNIPSTTRIVIGGIFTNIGGVSNCNNIILYNTSPVAWIPLGTGVGFYGVTGVGTTLPTGITTPVVFTVNSSVIAGITYIFIGGYFKNVGGSILCNSIVIYNLNTPGWTIYKPTLANDKTTPQPTLGTGVYFNNGSAQTPTTTEPGIVYNLTIVTSDNLNLLVGGQYYIFTNVTGAGTVPRIFNLLKVTVNKNTSLTYPYTFGFYYTPTFGTNLKVT